MEILFESSRLGKLAGLVNEDTAPLGDDKGQMIVHHPVHGYVTLHWDSDEAFNDANEANNASPEGGKSTTLMQTASYVRYRDADADSSSQWRTSSKFKAILDDVNVEKVNFATNNGLVSEWEDSDNSGSVTAQAEKE